MLYLNQSTTNILLNFKVFTKTIRIISEYPRLKKYRDYEKWFMFLPTIQYDAGRVMSGKDGIHLIRRVYFRWLFFGIGIDINDKELTEEEFYHNDSFYHELIEAGKKRGDKQ